MNARFLIVIVVLVCSAFFVVPAKAGTHNPGVDFDRGGYEKKKQITPSASQATRRMGPRVRGGDYTMRATAQSRLHHTQARAARLPCARQAAVVCRPPAAAHRSSGNPHSGSV